MFSSEMKPCHMCHQIINTPDEFHRCFNNFYVGGFTDPNFHTDKTPNFFSFKNASDEIKRRENSKFGKESGAFAFGSGGGNFNSSQPSKTFSFGRDLKKTDEGISFYFCKNTQTNVDKNTNTGVKPKDVMMNPVRETREQMDIDVKTKKTPSSKRRISSFTKNTQKLKNDCEKISVSIKNKSKVEKKKGKKKLTLTFKQKESHMKKIDTLVKKCETMKKELLTA